MSKGRIFSAMQPSGKFHLGNYMGALENWVKLQDEYDCIFAIADLHALTSAYADTSKLPGFIHDMMLDWLSAGLDPEKNIISYKAPLGIELMDSEKDEELHFEINGTQYNFKVVSIEASDLI